MRPPPQTGALAFPAGLGSPFLMVMRGDARAGAAPAGSPRRPRAPPPLPAALAPRRPSRPRRGAPAPGRGERPCAPQTKPAAMRGRPGSARRGVRDGAPGRRGRPPSKRRGPLVPQRRAVPLPPHPPPGLGELRGASWEVSGFTAFWSVEGSREDCGVLGWER